MTPRTLNNGHNPGDGAHSLHHGFGSLLSVRLNLLSGGPLWGIPYPIKAQEAVHTVDASLLAQWRRARAQPWTR